MAKNDNAPSAAHELLAATWRNIGSDAIGVNEADNADEFLVPEPVVPLNPFGTAKVLPTFDTANTDKDGNPIAVYPEETTVE